MNRTAESVAKRRAKLEQDIQASKRCISAKLTRGNVYLLMGKCATEKDLIERLKRLSQALKAFAPKEQ